MALFLSTFINKVDKKGRVSVPASFRAALTGLPYAGIVAYPSFRLQAIEGSGIDRMQEMSERHDRLDQFSEEHESLALIFSETQQLPFDPEGRITLPENFCAHAQITETVAFVGRGQTFQLWEPSLLQEHTAESRQRVRRNGMTLAGAEPRVTSAPP